MTIPDWAWLALGTVIAVLGFVTGRMDRKEGRIKKEADDSSEIKKDLSLVLYQVGGINNTLAEIKARLGSGDARMLSFERKLIRIETHLKLPEMKEE